MMTTMLFQVYSSMSPLVHIVDIGSAAIESLANVTVCSSTFYYLEISISVHLNTELCDSSALLAL